VRFAQVGMVALTLTFGCVRLGYDARRVPTDQRPAPHGDGGTDRGIDAAIADAGRGPDASALDGSRSMRDASASDAAIRPTDAGALDARVPDDTGLPNDGAMPSMEDSSIDAAAQDSAVEGGPVDFCPERSDALFCDGFEDPELARWSYTVTPNGTVARTTARFHSGAASLRATTGPAAPDSAARYGAKPFGHQMSGDIWLRYYYYIPSSTVVTTAFSTCVIEEIEPPFFGFALLVRPSQVDIGTGNTFYHGTMAFPRDQWTCVELHVQIDPAAGFFEAYLNGALAVRSPAIDTLPDMGYSSVDVGIHYADAAQGPVEAYVDDVVAGNTRLGCN
jgi:hypothetical protein